MCKGTRWAFKEHDAKKNQVAFHDAENDRDVSVSVTPGWEDEARALLSKPHELAKKGKG